MRGGEQEKGTGRKSPRRTPPGRAAASTSTEVAARPMEETAASPSPAVTPPVSSPVKPPAGAFDGARVETALNALEAQFRDLQKQVQHLQRMASIGTMAAILAHEFNNLLTPIQTYSQYALKRDDPALLRTAVERSFNSSQRLSVLCRRILGMSTQAADQIVELDARTLLQDSVEMVGRDFQKDSITVSIDAPEGLCFRTDPGAIQQVLFNLVINAWQAMLDRPGRLTLTASRHRGGEVVLTVGDTGSGIRAEDMSKVFEPFFTTKAGEAKSYRRGTGLGLHVCRQLVEEMGGKIGVESEWGRGTTVTVRLPG